MLAQFSWIRPFNDGSVVPQCSLLDGHGDIVGEMHSLENLVMDDGGQLMVESINLLSEGIERVSSVLNGGVEKTWDRERWGVCISVDGSVVYSLLDSNYSCKLNTKKLLNLLMEWRGFLIAANTEEVKAVEV